MRRFLPFAALLGVAFVLGCQDLGTGVEGAEGLGPQFAKKDKPRGGGGGGGGGGGNGKDLQAKFTTHDHNTHAHTNGPGDNFYPDDPLTIITTRDPSPGLVCGCDLPLLTPITPTGSDREMIRAIGLTIKVKSGEFQSVKVLVSDMEKWPRATADEVVWRTETIPVDPESVVISGTTTTIHLHADGLELTEKHETGVKGRIRIADVVITPAP